MKSISTIIITLFCSLCWAQIDLCPFNLTPEQTEIIRKLEAKGSVSKEVLIKLAKASQKHNEKHKEYVPEHTLEQLEQVRGWAVGGVFQRYAHGLGLIFDGKSYMKDYPVYVDKKPYMALFNFGLATGTQYFEIDIMITAINLESELSKQQVLSPDSFKEYYLEKISEYGFEAYLATE